MTTGTFTVGRPAAVTGPADRVAPPPAGVAETTRLVVPAPFGAYPRGPVVVEAPEPAFARVAAPRESRGSARTGNCAIGSVSSGSGIAVAGGSTIARTVATASPA